MLSKLITYIDDQTSRFATKHGLAERVQDVKEEDPKVFPGVYKGADEYQMVDLEQQCSYHRMTGQRVIEEVPEIGVSGCSKGLRITFPMVMVGCLPIDKPNQYRFEEISNSVSYELMRVKFPKETRGAIRASSAELNVTGINSDRMQVWNNEFENVEMAVPFGYTLFSINYELVVLTDSSSLNEGC